MQKNRNDPEVVPGEYIIDAPAPTQVLQEQTEAEHAYDPIGEAPVTREPSMANCRSSAAA